MREAAGSSPVSDTKNSHWCRQEGQLVKTAPVLQKSPPDK